MLSLGWGGAGVGLLGGVWDRVGWRTAGRTVVHVRAHDRSHLLVLLSDDPPIVLADVGYALPAVALPDRSQVLILHVQRFQIGQILDACRANACCYCCWWWWWWWRRRWWRWW